MILFYSNDIRDDQAWFGEEEARHCVQVLRKKPGDALSFVDGRGNWYEGVISETGKRHFVAEIQNIVAGAGKRDFYLHLAIAPPKNMDRFEWFLEKATEIGVDEITPLTCEHSERSKIRMDRLEKILLSAMKQSLRAYLPKLNELTDFVPFIEDHFNEKNSLRFVAHCREQDLPLLKDNCQPAKNVCLLIGPEGDFSTMEIDLANQQGFKSISLGNARLRTETAGIVACHIVNLVNE
jgi:16S rRNA (uracil1498-N3)-methyltransferase